MTTYYETKDGEEIQVDLNPIFEADCCGSYIAAFEITEISDESIRSEAEAWFSRKETIERLSRKFHKLMDEQFSDEPIRYE